MIMLYKRRNINDNTIFVKKFLFFLVFLFIFGCNSKNSSINSSQIINCPTVYFSSEHRSYISAAKKIIDLDNLHFKAYFNNYEFSKPCKSSGAIFLFPLEILIIAEPLLIKEKEIQLPIYIAALDSNENLIETQFFLIKDNIAMDFENKKLIETDIAKLLNLSFSTDKVISRLIIGFMLDNEKIKLLN
tara:strand:- start:206 stop:769 length:564 start_codon:yes stop_codon:yes gene_type:complete